MQIYNNQSPCFGCIRVKSYDIVRKEGAFINLRDAQALCEKFKWHLYIGQNGYEFVNPANSQSYTAPFGLKRHFNKNRLLINMNNANNKKVAFRIECQNRNEINSLYKEIKEAKGLAKMVKILTVLENNLNFKKLNSKILRCCE